MTRHVVTLQQFHKDAVNLISISFITTSHLLSFDDFKTQCSYTFHTYFGSNIIWSLNQWLSSDLRLVCPWFQNSKWHWTTTTFRSLAVLGPWIFMDFHVSHRGANTAEYYLFYIPNLCCIKIMYSKYRTPSMHPVSVCNCRWNGPKLGRVFFAGHLTFALSERQWLGPTFIGAYIAIWLSFIGAQVRCIPWKNANVRICNNDEVSTIKMNGWISNSGGHKMRRE